MENRTIKSLLFVACAELFLATAALAFATAGCPVLRSLPRNVRSPVKDRVGVYTAKMARAGGVANYTTAGFAAHPVHQRKWGQTQRNQGAFALDKCCKIADEKQCVSAIRFSLIFASV
jgi:hypothetical protein